MRRRWVVLVAVAAFAVGWITRQPERALPERVVRWVRGPVEVVEVSRQRTDPVTPACADQDRVALALLDLPDDAPVGPPATESACRARVELAMAVTTARQLDRIGRPEPFPPDLPDKYREAALTAVAREVLETCPELATDLVEVDCSEFPCLALFVRPPSGGASVSSCPAWVDVYGPKMAGSSGVLVGPDGERIAYELVGPSVPADLRPPEPERDGGPWVPTNAGKRLEQRSQHARDEVMVGYDARELTEAEQREDQRRFWQELADQGQEGAADILQMLEEEWAAKDARRR